MADSGEAKSTNDGDSGAAPEGPGTGGKHVLAWLGSQAWKIVAGVIVGVLVAVVLTKINRPEPDPELRLSVDPISQPGPSQQQVDLPVRLENLTGDGVSGADLLLRDQVCASGVDVPGHGVRRARCVAPSASLDGDAVIRLAGSNGDAIRTQGGEVVIDEECAPAVGTRVTAALSVDDFTKRWNDAVEASASPGCSALDRSWQLPTGQDEGRLGEGSFFTMEGRGESVDRFSLTVDASRKAASDADATGAIRWVIASVVSPSRDDAVQLLSSGSLHRGCEEGDLGYQVDSDDARNGDVTYELQSCETS